MEIDDTNKLNYLLSLLGINTEDKKIISTLDLYLNDLWVVTTQAPPLENFSEETFQELFEGEKLSGFHYKEYDKEKKSYISDFKVLVGKKLSIDELINILGDSIGNYINVEDLDELKENAAQYVVVFNDDNTVKSLDRLYENTIAVDSPEDIFKMIDEMKKIKSEKGSISPIDALKNALNGTTIGQISEATNAEHNAKNSNYKGVQSHDDQ